MGAHGGVPPGGEWGLTTGTNTLPAVQADEGALKLLRRIILSVEANRISERFGSHMLQRMVPPLLPSGRCVTMPEAEDIRTPDNYDDAMGSACAAMARGEITPNEARQAMIVIRARWRAKVDAARAKGQTP